MCDDRPYCPRRRLPSEAFARTTSMPSLSLRLIALSCGLALPLFGCNAVLGLDKLGLEPSKGDAGNGKGGAGSMEMPEGGEQGDCQTNQECTTLLTMQGGGDNAADGGTVPAVCVKDGHHCVALYNED